MNLIFSILFHLEVISQKSLLPCFLILLVAVFFVLLWLLAAFEATLTDTTDMSTALRFEEPEADGGACFGP